METYMQIPILAVFIIVPKWKHPKCPLADKWINKIYYSHTVESYWAMTTKVLIHAIACMNLKNIALSERSQDETTCLISFI